MQLHKVIGALAITLGLFAVPAQAAHLVGGEITYDCLGNNQYQIKLRIYRDCASGGAAFDNTINFSIFDINGNLLHNPSVTKGTTVPVSTGSGNPCLTVPPNLCTEYADYVHTMTLPAIVGGYTISYQRCCRNATISNISANGMGNTYTVTIPSMDQCNSTPQFSTVPPIVLCLNDQLNVDASATDADGDSLHYEFCDILTGGSSFNPSPNPSTAPPYTTIPFISPHTSSQPIPGSPVLSIDPLTGYITGKPTSVGQFVVGICVSEYDTATGALMSTVRRDYQFNVTNCIVNTVADMLTQQEDASMLCSGLTIQFQGQTPAALGFLWDFGDTTTLADTSSSPTPTYTFPDTGWYAVTMIVNPGLVCTDTVTEMFHIQYPPDYQIQWSGVACFEVQDFTFRAVGTAPADASFSWYFGFNSNTFGATGDSVEHVRWNDPGKYTVKLTVHSATCPDTLYDTIEVLEWTLPVNVGPDTAIAYLDTAHLGADTGVAWYWFADKPVYWSNFQGQFPQMWMQDDSTHVFVFATDEQGCRGTDTLMVYWLPRQTKPDLSNVMNTITPNGDGLNDVLDLSEVTFGDNCQLTVMNRWGQTVYYQEIYDHQWGGTTQDGALLTPGTYYVILKFGLREVRYAGPVTILY